MKMDQFSILGRCIAVQFFEFFVEGGLRIKTDLVQYLKDGYFGICFHHQAFCFLATVCIDEVEEISSGPLVNHL